MTAASQTNKTTSSGANNAAVDANVTSTPPAKVDPQGLGYVPSDLLLRGFVTAFARAAREGLPAKILAGHVNYRSTDESGRVVNVLEEQQIILREKIKELDLKIVRTRDVYETTKDAEEAEDFKKRWRTADEARSKAKVKLALLESQAAAPAPAAMPEQLHTYVDVVRVALIRLALCDNSLSQREYRALQAIVPALALRQDDVGQWWGEATVRLNATNGDVIDFGPVTWSLGWLGRGSKVRQSPSAEAARTTSRGSLHEALKAAPQLNRHAVLLLLNATLPELPFAVLHGLNGHPWPDWVSQPWRERPFVDWVSKVYVNLGESWRRNGGYAVFSPKRQLMAHLIADSGPLARREITDRYPTLTRVDLQRAGSDFKSPTAPTWYPSVLSQPTAQAILGDGLSRAQKARIGGRAHGRERVFSPVRCVCGRAARVVARVAEVPRCLLCECGRMPDAERFGMSTDVVFPPDYVTVLMLSKAECEARIQDRQSSGYESPTADRSRTGLAARLLSCTTLSERPTSEPDLVSQVEEGEAEVREQLADLVQRGFLDRLATTPPRYSTRLLV